VRRLRFARPLEDERLEDGKDHERHVIIAIEGQEAVDGGAREQDEAEPQPDVQAEEDDREPDRLQRLPHRRSHAPTGAAPRDERRRQRAQPGYDQDVRGVQMAQRYPAAR